jgi:hypothetical protein
MEKRTSIRAFVSAMAAHWFTAMSGPLSVPAAALALWLDNQAAKALLGLTAFACIWAAAYAIWRHERERAVELEDKHEAPKNPFPDSILMPSKFYSTAMKDEVSDILGRVSAVLNTQVSDSFLLAKCAIESQDDDPTRCIETMQRVEALSMDARRDLFDVLFKDYPDYRIELNSLLFPIAPISFFAVGAQGYRKGLEVWGEHRGGINGNGRQKIMDWMAYTRMTFGTYRDSLLTWSSDVQSKIEQTRRHMNHDKT